MAKSNNESTLRSELFSGNLYKRAQGRLTRQLTAVGLAVVLFFGIWTLSQGPLSRYVNSYYSVRISYAASQPDETLDAELTRLGQKHGAALAQSEQRRQERSLEFRFPTSRFWRTNSALQTDMLAQADALATEIEQGHGAAVTITPPTHQSPRAREISVGVPVALCVLGLWIIFRLVNWPRFADFLISVEAEMDKVTWASWKDLIRATGVVIGTMIILGMVLFAYDLVWVWFFRLVQVLQPTG